MKNSTRVTWPTQIMLVRHGQSAGNVALEEAEARGLSTIDISMRDVDVPLSPLGLRQARALGAWLSDHPPSKRPTLILASTYVRAEQTALVIAKAIDIKPDAVIFDERLREREFGILDRLTKKGIIEKYPRQAELHHHLQKFYYRPPGGESWCDVILRLRSMTSSLAVEYPGERVMIICHTVVIFCFRYLLERLTEKEILQIDRREALANCSLTSYELKGCPQLVKPKLKQFNFVAPVSNAGELVTRKKDRAVEN